MSYLSEGSKPVASAIAVPDDSTQPENLSTEVAAAMDASDPRSEIKHGHGKRYRSRSGDSLQTCKRGSVDGPNPGESHGDADGEIMCRPASDPELTDRTRSDEAHREEQGEAAATAGLQGSVADLCDCYRFGADAGEAAPEPNGLELELMEESHIYHPAGNEAAAAMDCDRKEFENMVNIMCQKMAHIIVESRLGKKIHTPCKVHADVPDWFNLSLADMPEVVKDVKRLLVASGGLWDPAAPLVSFCVEISLKTADGVPLVLEQWTLTLDASAPSGAKPSAAIVNQLGVLLKSLLVTTRLTIGYKLSRQQSQESHIIFYKIYIGEPDLQGLGEASDKMMIGEVGTPICSLNLSLHYRTKLALSTHTAEPIVMKSDHFKPEQSPRVRRLTGFTERRPSDSVEMIGASSSSSSNMDTKTTGGSSTDSDQRRRVAAFADDPSDRPTPASDVPFLRLVGEPPPSPATTTTTVTTAAVDVSMTDGSPAQPTTTTSQRSVSDQPRPVAAAAAVPGAASPPSDDFVMVELRTPFSETSSDSELGAFFRHWQAAPPLASLAGGTPAAPAPAATATAGTPPPQAPPPPDQQVVTLSEQLARFALKAQEYDEMIAELESNESGKQ